MARKTRPKAKPTTRAAKWKRDQRARDAAGPPRRLIRRDRRWPEPELLTPRHGMKAWRKLLEQIPGYDPWAESKGFKFSRPRAHRAMRFFHDQLSHAKGERARTPFWLEPWEQAVIANLFGWVDAKGLRRFNLLFLYIPRKNGKTPLCAAILALMMYELGVYGAEHYCIGHDFKQASLVFAHLEMMVRHNPELLARTQSIHKGQLRQIVMNQDAGYSFLKPVPFDADAAQGFKLNGAAIDEVHTHPDGSMIDAIVGGTAGEREPLVVMLTTADYEREGSPCNKWHDRACEVRDGKRSDPHLLPVIYEASKEDDWTDPKVWAAANPNLGVSVTRRFIEQECKRAQEDPAHENIFKRYNLNIRTEQADRWLTLEAWDACAGKWSWADARKRVVHVGIDLASVRDTTAIAFMYRKKRKIHLRVEFWAPRERAEERQKRDRVDYLTWAKMGFITLNEGRNTDFGLLVKRLVYLRDRRNITFGGVFYDPHEAGQFARVLEEEHGFVMTGFAQYPKNYNEATKLFEQLVTEGNLIQEPTQILRWQIANVSLYVAGTDHVMPSKKRSGDKIDGPVAAIMALASIVASPKESDTSVYDSHDPISV